MLARIMDPIFLIFNFLIFFFFFIGIVYIKKKENSWRFPYRRFLVFDGWLLLLRKGGGRRVVGFGDFLGFLLRWLVPRGLNMWCGSVHTSGFGGFLGGWRSEWNTGKGG